jgi:hypothetical protein
MTLKLKEPLKEYESDIRELYEDLDSSLDSKEALLSEIELIWYSRYGITDKGVIEIDKKYLPTIYQKMKSAQPDIAEYFKAKMIAAGVPFPVFS